MPRPSLNLEHASVRLHAGDLELLEKYYPQLGARRAIRKIVRNHLRKLEERETRQLGPVKLESFDADT